MTRSWCEIMNLYARICILVWAFYNIYHLVVCVSCKKHVSNDNKYAVTLYHTSHRMEIPIKKSSCGMTNYFAVDGVRKLNFNCRLRRDSRDSRAVAHGVYAKYFFKFNLYFNRFVTFKHISIWTIIYLNSLFKMR